MDLEKTTMLDKRGNRGKIAIFQIIVLVIGIMAFAFLMGGEAGLVSATSTQPGDKRCRNNNVESYTGEGWQVMEECGDKTCEVGECVSEGSSDSSGEGDFSAQDTLPYFSTALSGGSFANKMGWIGSGSSTPTTSIPTTGSNLNLNTVGFDQAWSNYQATGDPTTTSSEAFWGEDLSSFGDTSSTTGTPSQNPPAPDGYGLFSNNFWGAGEAGGEGFFADFVGGVNLEGAGIGSWQAAGNALSYIGSSMAMAAIGSAITTIAFDVLGAGDRNMQQVKTGALLGTGAGGAAAIIGIIAGSGPPGWAMAIIGAAITGIYAWLNYQKFAQEQVTFMSNSWSPVDGGDHCEECNELEYGCSEYQCHTFGKACDIINKGTEKEKCVHINPDDTLPPNITALDESLQDNFKYVPINQVSPPDRGVKVIQKSGEEKIPPYTALTLGVETSEPAECRMDTKRKDSYEDMMTSISRGYQQYKHPFSIPHSAMQSKHAIEKSFRGNESNMSEEYENLIDNLDLEEMNDYEFYIRCKDTNGNIVSQEFVIEVSVDDGPDTQAPEIIGTNYAEGEAFVGFNKSNHLIQVTTNEPATCRWSKNNLNYENMKNNITEPLGENLGQYTYKGTLTGVKDREDNVFYIRCQDKPNFDPDTDEGKPYANEEPYKLVLKGTEPLLIDEATVNGMGNGSLIKDSTNEIRVDFEIETSSGAEHGKSRCYYGEEKGSENIEFYNEGEDGYTQTNVQKEMYLTEGDYTYFFKCEDEGGNVARTNLSFTIETDRSSPRVVRAYKEQESLNIITGEEGECVFSSRDDRGCTYEYDEGREMETSSNGKIHSTEWKPEETLYIKCKDKYGNRALPGQCSIIVRPFDF